MTIPDKPARRTDPFRVTMMIFSVIGFMYFTGEVLKPLALSVLLSFALAPAASLLAWYCPKWPTPMTAALIGRLMRWSLSPYGFPR